jgi:hypothetical protein
MVSSNSSSSNSSQRATTTQNPSTQKPATTTQNMTSTAQKPATTIQKVDTLMYTPAPSCSEGQTFFKSSNGEGICILNSTIDKLKSVSTSIDTNMLVSDAMSSMKNSNPSNSCPMGQKYTQSSNGKWSCK